MRRFARLRAELESAALDAARIEALCRYLAAAEPADAAWGVHLLVGGRPRRSMTRPALRAAALAGTALPAWLFDVCDEVAGDLAETVAHLLHPPSHPGDMGLAAWMLERVLRLPAAPPQVQASLLHQWCDELQAPERLLLVELIGGSFRAGIDRGLVARAFARHAGIEPTLAVQRLARWTERSVLPDADALAALTAPPAAADLAGQPYPFAPRRDLQRLDPQLGRREEWLVAWRRDGVRAQLIWRAGQCWIWTEAGELVTQDFADVAAAAAALGDGTAVEGELLAWTGAAGAMPASLRFVAHDLLEARGHDLRGLAHHLRRERLGSALQGSALPMAPLVDDGDWESLARRLGACRSHGFGGMILNHRDASYGHGLSLDCRPAPLKVVAVLLYAGADRGGAPGELSFAVWNRPPLDAGEAAAVADAIARRDATAPGSLRLVVVASVAADPAEVEGGELERLIRAATIGRFGPVRSVRPSVVFELEFDGVTRSPRRRSGLTLQRPRLCRRRDDLALHEVAALAMLAALDAPPQAA